MEEVIGKVFGYLRIISKCEESNYHYNCECIKCGFEVKQTLLKLRSLHNQNHSGCPFCKTPNDDLTGKIYATTKVLGINKEETKLNLEKGKRSDTYWDCECIKCKKKTIRPKYYLEDIKKANLDHCKSCPTDKNGNWRDLVGQTFGYLYVIERGKDRIDKNGILRRMLLCQCVCGKEKEVSECLLLSGKASSCGCKRKELISKALRGIRKKNIYDLSGEYGICYNEDKTRYCFFDLEDYNLIKDYCWTLPNGEEGYVFTTCRDDNDIIKRVPMHRLIMGVGDYKESNGTIVIDHINHNRSDNRKNNLRICTPAQNGINKKLKKTSSTGYTGVYYTNPKKNGKKWVARIAINHKNLYLGRYENIEEAIAARKEAEKKYFGEFAYDPEQDTRLQHEQKPNEKIS